MKANIPMTEAARTNLNSKLERRRRPLVASVALLSALGVVVTACSSAPPTTMSGFLSSYSRLERVSDTRLKFVSPMLRGYRSFIVDPVQMRSQRGDLKPEDRAEVARYFRTALVSELRDRGFTVTDTPDAGTGRVRIALTNVQDATWWMKMHPGSSLAGAGRGGVAMEGEIIDSVTGDQLAAVVQSGVGSQFTLGNFSTVADVKNVIDQWVKAVGERLTELRASR